MAADKPAKAAETSSLMEDLNKAYGTESHAVWTTTLDHTCLTDYEPVKLSSFRIFCLSHGTIFQNPILIAEQILITLVFAASAIPVYWYFKQDMDEEDGISVRRFIRLQESKMRAFAMIMTGLAAFLLSFYTSIAVGRWWTMRAQGVGQIKTAAVDLTMLLYQQVTQDPEILSAVQRYGRASLMLIFMWRQQELGNLKSILMQRDLLTQPECELLIKCQHCLHETIWAWQTNIVTKLHKEGKIKSDQLYSLLIQKCTDGRAAAQCIHTHLAVRIPMQYVHLLGLLVKMHNFILSVIMGVLFGAALRNGYVILCVQLFGRTLILPFLFNAILLINCDLSDPFNGGEADFPGDVYVANLGKDCQGILDVTNNVPDWLKDGAP